MNIPIIIRYGDQSIEGYLSPTGCGKAIAGILPFSSPVNTWGEEIYFEIPLAHGLDETAADTVDLGDIGYWPTGRAFCIFFGKTPVSGKNEIRPASAVNIIGKITSSLDLLFSLGDGDEIRVEKR